MFLKVKKRRSILPLNVIPLIDICSMIIIFFVMDSFFGQSSVVVPQDLNLPKSVSEENVDNAVSVTLHNNEIIFSPINKKYPLSSVLQPQSKETLELKKNIQSYIQSIPNNQKGSGILLNFITDEKTIYREIFQVVKIFRENGFDSILFVAEGGK